MTPPAKLLIKWRVCSISPTRADRRFPNWPKFIQTKDSPWSLPRPMINSPDFDFSFSGLKTAVRYLLQKIPRTVLDGSQGLSLKIKIAADFQQAVVDVLLAKTAKALEKYRPKTLIVAGGVSANQSLRQQFGARLAADYPEVKLLLPTPSLSIDNATMIAL